VETSGIEPASNRADRPASHRAGPSRLVRRGPWLVLAAIVVVVAGTALAVRTLSPAGWPGAASACTGTAAPITVAASQGDVAMLSTLARRWNSTNPASGGRCLAAKVIAAAPADVAAQLGPGWDPAHEGAPPQVWLPDSSAWLAAAALRPDAARLLPEQRTSIATSPVVLAVQQSVARVLGWPQHPPGAEKVIGAFADPAGWARLGKPSWSSLRIGLPDPQTSTAGLAMVLTMFDPTGSGTVSNDQLLAALKFSQALGPAAPDVQTFLAQQNQPESPSDPPVVGAFPALERDVAVYDAGAPANPLVPAYQSKPVVADFPYTILSGNWVDAIHRTAAEQFRDFLLAPAAQGVLASRGLRAPDGTAREAKHLLTAQGFPNTIATPRPPVTPAGLSEVMNNWSGLQRPLNLLTALDTSGSMNEPVPGSTLSKLQLLKQTEATGFALLTSPTNIGLWDFSVAPDRAGEHRELVAYGRLTDNVGPVNRQKALFGAIARLNARGFTPLYDAAYAAFHELQNHWRPNATNAVILVTDGKNELNGGLDLGGLVDRLKRERRTDKPVPIFCIAVGSAADANALQQIAGATGGHTLMARDPLKAVNSLILAFAGRLR
jgi:Ca-activated chloride channel family protein